MATSSSGASSPLSRSGRHSAIHPDLNIASSSADGDVDEEDEEDDNNGAAADDEEDNEEEEGPDKADDDGAAAASSVPVDTLVTHLLAAKRALSSVTLVLRAGDLVTGARRLHEQAVVLAAQTALLRRGISEQVRVLLRLRRGLTRALDASRREFKALLRTLDEAHGRLEGAMAMLRGTVVESVFRPAGEEPRSLLDFVDTDAVEKLREAVKACLGELQAAQMSFDSDVLRFDDHLRVLNKAMSSSPPATASPTGSAAYQPTPQLLAALTANSHAMAEHLASLTRHFDMCVTAVRSTEGGAALAKRRAAAEASSATASALDAPEADPNAVSISGVIGDAAHEPLSDTERAEVVAVVLQDAPEVSEVVAELEAVLAAMSGDYAALRAQTDAVGAAHAATLAAFEVLRGLGVRLPAYVAAEGEFLERWGDERRRVAERLGEMDELRAFYSRYAAAYDSLILEAERRRAVEERVRGLWRKAREGAERLAEVDRREREAFMQETGDFLPTDLWVGMDAPMLRWEARPAVQREEGGAGEQGTGEEREDTRAGLDSSVPALPSAVVDAARERLARAGER